eukprot:CAMPEP_0168792964 /NCGR_PEP_ID=MMETSP0725-20121227/14819_1 /TAXON_ID=265536 /ORGANISM="Amphiprora sp., Strain CCMP467" /LENGTH=66 /DNA_ID=CAMNT_0008843681 /DNA_START=197 /DNA_END=394 /DNA_ORIENTATION=+
MTSWHWITLRIEVQLFLFVAKPLLWLPIFIIEPGPPKSALTLCETDVSSSIINPRSSKMISYENKD